MLNTTNLILTTLLSALILIISIYSIKSQWAKIALSLSQLLLFVNSGIAVAYNIVPLEFATYHYIFTLAYICSFLFFWKISGKWTLKLSDRLNARMYTKLNSKIIFQGFLFCYISSIALLIYPEFKLNNLFEFHPPDIKSWFAERFEEAHTNPIVSIIGYLKILLFPFFFIHLYKYRNKPIYILISFFLIIYVEYASTQYISRGTVMLYALTMVIFYYHHIPSIRKKILISSILAAPLISVWLEYWMVVRLGNEFYMSGIWDSFETILDMQTSFVTDTGLKIIESGKHTDLKNYFIWIFSLPFPKAIFGAVEGARINYEISEIVLGVPRGSQSFYVVLGGVVAESIYIYGKYFFWIHAITFGAVGATVIKLFSKINNFHILTAWTVIFFSYKMPGGGISSVLPPVINTNILLYLFLLFASNRINIQKHQLLSFSKVKSLP